MSNHIEVSKYKRYKKDQPKQVPHIVEEGLTMKIIGYIHTDFSTKFGIPRQSGLVQELKSKIILNSEFRNPDAFRGIEGFSHLWLIWEFSQARREGWSPTVKPPRLGGNTKMGVFATRSPFRPNSIGLSSVKLEKLELHPEFGPILHIAGADLMDGTPIYDIKPYVPYADSHGDATEGFTSGNKDYQLTVEFPEDLLGLIPEEKREGLIGVLRQDPRPSYHKDPYRIYGFEFAGNDVRFTVDEHQLRVCEIVKL